MMHLKTYRRWPAVSAPAMLIALLSGCAGVAVEPPESESIAAEMALKRPDVSPGGWYAVNLRVANNALKNSNYSAAERIFRRLHDAMPEVLEPLLGLGDVLFARKAYSEAAGAFRTALALKSDDPIARRGLGEALVRSGRVKDGIMHLERALANGKNASLFNKLAIAHEIDGAPDTARAYYRSGLALHPDDLALRNNLALSLALSGDYPEAVSQLRRVLENPAATRRHRMNMAFVHGMSGDFGAARLAVGDPDAAAGNQRLSRIRTLALAGDRRQLLGMLNVSAASVPQPVQRNGDKRPTMTATEEPVDDAVNVNRKPVDGIRNPMDLPENIVEIAAVESEEKHLNNGKNRDNILTSSIKMDHFGSGRKSDPKVNAGRDRDPRSAASGPAAGAYRVQIGAYRNKGSAVRGRAIFTRMAPVLLDRLETVVKTRTKSGAKAVNYRLRTAPLASQMDAVDLCENLQSRGIQCLVIKQNNRLWSTA